MKNITVNEITKPVVGISFEQRPQKTLSFTAEEMRHSQLGPEHTTTLNNIIRLS